MYYKVIYEINAIENRKYWTKCTKQIRDLNWFSESVVHIFLVDFVTNFHNKFRHTHTHKYMLIALKIYHLTHNNSKWHIKSVQIQRQNTGTYMEMLFMLIVWFCHISFPCTKQTMSKRQSVEQDEKRDRETEREWDWRKKILCEKWFEHFHNNNTVLWRWRDSFCFVAVTRARVSTAPPPHPRTPFHCTIRLHWIPFAIWFYIIKI